MVFHHFTIFIEAGYKKKNEFEKISEVAVEKNYRDIFSRIPFRIGSSSCFLSSTMICMENGLTVDSNNYIVHISDFSDFDL